MISAQDRATDITIGDLSPAGVSEVIVNIPTTGAGGRNVVLDTQDGGETSQITVAPFLHTYINDEDPENPLLVQKNELQVVNATTGVTTYLLGMKAEDQTTIRQHGGSAHIGQLSTNEGTLAFDLSGRPAGTVQTVTMTTPALDSGNWITSHAIASGEFVLNAINYPTVQFHGLRVVDSITMNVAEPTQATGLNQVFLDSSSLVGTLNVVPLGDSSAQNVVTVSKLSEQGNIAVQGGSTSTTTMFGTGRLADIRGDVSIHNAVLTIDNSLAQSYSFLTMTETTFSGWTIPGFIGNPALDLRQPPRRDDGSCRSGRPLHVGRHAIEHRQRRVQQRYVHPRSGVHSRLDQAADAQWRFLIVFGRTADHWQPRSHQTFVRSGQSAHHHEFQHGDRWRDKGRV